MEREKIIIQQEENKPFNTVDFLRINVGVVNRAEIVNKILEFALTAKGKFITYLNAHCVNIACSDQEYRSILNKSDLVYAGGQGVVWASRFLGKGLPERVNIMDFYKEFFKEAVKKNISFYFLGAQPHTVQKLVEVIGQKFSGLNIKGYYHGYFDKRKERSIIQEINFLKPNVLIIGFGVPKQEKWIYNHLNELDANLCWAVGGVFDLLAGRLRKAPKWISAYGLEWLYLGLQDPRRLLKRYLFGNFLFIYRILKYKLKKI